jgi:hypothetical protein
MFEIVLGTGLVVLYLFFWAWHSPWKHKLTKAEIDHYLGIIEMLPLPSEESKAIISRLRRWAEALRRVASTRLVAEWRKPP